MDPARRHRIREALLALTLPGVGKEAVLESIRLLDAEVVTADAGLPGDLDHYLRRRSYEKALVFLDGGTPGAGTCGRGP
ncbi:hypothetical protein LBMAG55_10640 [Verrucomicrobiota bacterium]|nr:hypothetical protein LBMAG55_10640 [Verrucomicrobiota bacterium]